MNAKISVFVTCIEAIIYLLLYNLHDCTFKQNKLREILNVSLKPVWYLKYTTAA